MKKIGKLEKLQYLFLPNKKLNYFIISIIILGVIFGSLFLTVISNSDKNLVITKITDFFTSVTNNSLNYQQAFISSILINYIYIFLIALLGLSIVGIPFIVFLIFFKGFIIGFSVASLIVTYKLKGIIPSILYIFPCQLLNILVVLLLSIYGLTLAKHIFLLLFNKSKINIKNTFKKFIVIIIIALFLSLIATCFEVFVFPFLTKLYLKLFI
ncbi:MAG: stage II sporulation protein M [bacterium]|nr:stage II sporulation protein M [bacterium]